METAPSGSQWQDEKPGGHPSVTSDPEAGAPRNPASGDGVMREGHVQGGCNKKGWMER